MFVTMADLAKKLHVSRQTIRIWIKKWPGFPIEIRGACGIGYRFDFVAVVAFLTAEKFAREAAKQREPAQSQLFKPDDLSAASTLDPRRLSPSLSWLETVSYAELSAMSSAAIAAAVGSCA